MNNYILDDLVHMVTLVILFNIITGNYIFKQI